MNAAVTRSGMGNDEPKTFPFRSDAGEYPPAMKTREQLEALLAELEEELPRIIDRVDPTDRYRAFAFEASCINEAAGPDDSAYVSRRIDSLILGYGLNARQGAGYSIH